LKSRKRTGYSFSKLLKIESSGPDYTFYLKTAINGSKRIILKDKVSAKNYKF
jgi:hypothetical protein